jgi:outer membrane protein assembly factor BamA
VPEIRAGLERVKLLYGARGFPDVEAQPETQPDDASYRIDVILHITEGPHKK